MTRRKTAKPAEPPLAPAPTTCVYEVPGEGRCRRPIEKYEHCSKHLAESPQERSNQTTLLSALQTARTRRDDFGQRLLDLYVVLSDGSTPIPDDLQREYRALWHRHQYIKTVRDSRRVGDELPAEVTMR
jgi:hypothetical protein